MTSPSCSFTVKQLREELETLRESVKNALHQSWDEVELLNEKCSAQEKEIKLLKQDLCHSKKNEEGWKEKCRKMNRKMVVLFEKTDAKAWYQQKIKIPCRHFSSTGVSVLKSDVNIQKGEKGLNSLLTRSLSKRILSKCNLDTTSTLTNTITSTYCDSTNCGIVNDVSGSQSKVNGPKSNPDVLSLQCSNNQINGSKRLIKSQEKRYNCLSCDGDKKNLLPSLEAASLHDLIESFKSKIQTRDKEIEALEEIIRDSVALIHQLRTKVDLTDYMSSESSRDEASDASSMSIFREKN